MTTTGLAARFVASDQGRGFRAFRHRPFRNLYLGFLVQQTGFWLSHLTLQGYVDALADGEDASAFGYGAMAADDRSTAIGSTSSGTASAARARSRRWSPRRATSR